MEKQFAISLFGGAANTARAIGITPQAVSNWPATLSNAVRDRVLAAALRSGKFINHQDVKKWLDTQN